MDFDDSTAEAAYRATARQWLSDTVPRFLERYPKLRSLPLSCLDEHEALEASRDWQKTKYDAGYACLTWPKEAGGQGLSSMHAVLFLEEEEKHPVPWNFVPLSVSLGTCAPAILHHGSEEQRQRYLPKLASGEELWCQLFSEPEAGSDLAGLRTRAERDGDDWIVNGQKVWTTGAHFADWAVLVTRHDTTLPKHKGLTYFVVDMASEGIEARPIRQIPGDAEFNEVFLTNVRIPDSQRLDQVGAGWTVAITTLMNERHGRSQLRPDVADLVRLAKTVEIDGAPAIENSAIRDQLADWYVASRGVELNYYRGLTAISKGGRPGPEGSISKVVRAPLRQDLCSFGADLLDMGGVLLEGDPALTEFATLYLHSPRSRIAAGTDEILRNIIAERVLGLPGDIRVDRDKAFGEIPRRPAS
jgi:alkylation response protein AidB-like acyl-CoA dehydrogenase